jgi:carbohydrate ABC transporter membrane protein 2, CUT1 family (TC 3.A.1.1.-)
MAKQTDNQVSAVRRAKHGWILTLFFSILAVFYLYPIFLVLINSLKKKDLL